MMPNLRSLMTAVRLKRLKEQGFSNEDVVDMVKSDGREAVLELGDDNPDEKGGETK